MNAQGDLGGDHERTQVEGSLAASLRGPVLVYLDQLTQGLDELALRQSRHSHALSRVVETLRVLLRAEGSNRAIRLTVGLDALEDRLAVVENVGGRVHAERLVRAHLCVVPALFFVPIDGHHVIGEVLAEAWVRQNLS